MSQDRCWRDPLAGALPSTFWGSLPAADRAALTAAGTVLRFPPDHRLCRQDLDTGRVFLIFTGEVEVFRDDHAGQRTVLARRGPGDIIGELAAVDRAPASATVVTMTGTVALVITVRRFVEVCKARPELTWLVLQSAVTRLRASDTHRTRLRSDVRTRTIMILLDLAESQAPDASPETPVTLRVSQQDLADMVSASLVSVTRVLEELRGLGAASTGRRRIVVRLDLLRALARPA
jgi:CRP/FNR family transcriptional regulator, cyclic AMP receptor protein